MSFFFSGLSFEIFYSEFVRDYFDFRFSEVFSVVYILEEGDDLDDDSSLLASLFKFFSTVIFPDILTDFFNESISNS